MQVSYNSQNYMLVKTVAYISQNYAGTLGSDLVHTDFETQIIYSYPNYTHACTCSKISFKELTCLSTWLVRYLVVKLQGIAIVALMQL